MKVLSDLTSLKWGDWLYTIVSAAVGAAATTIAANPVASVIGAVQFTPRQLMILAASAALVAVAGVLRKSPLPDKAVEVALLPGVHRIEEVQQIMKVTAPGIVPTPEVAAAILNKPVSLPEVPKVP